MDKNADFLLLKITGFYSNLLDRIIFFLLTIWLKIFIEFIIYIFEIEFYIMFSLSLNKNIILILTM